MTGLFHLPAPRQISLLEMAPARVMTGEGKWVSRQITQLERLHCACLHWMFFLEGNSYSVSCRRSDYLYSLKGRSKKKQEEWSVWEENTARLCCNCTARFENVLHLVFVVLAWGRSPFAFVDPWGCSQLLEPLAAHPPAPVCHCREGLTAARPLLQGQERGWRHQLSVCLSVIYQIWHDVLYWPFPQGLPGCGCVSAGLWGDPSVTPKPRGQQHPPSCVAVFHVCLFPIRHSWQCRSQGWASRGLKLIKSVGIDAF